MSGVLEEIPSRQRDVILRRFGIKNGHSETLEEVGRAYGVTRERIRQIEHEAIETLGKFIPDIKNKIRFIKRWQNSLRVAAVAKAEGLSIYNTSALAHKIRAAGIPLKNHARGPKALRQLSKRERSAVDPKFKARHDRCEEFVKMWNSRMPTHEIAKTLGYGTVTSVNAKAAQLRGVGYPCILRGMPRIVKVPTEEFVSMWQRAKDMKELSGKLGQSTNTISNRAVSLRKKGVTLKYFGMRSKLTPQFISRMNKISKEALR